MRYQWSKNREFPVVLTELKSVFKGRDYVTDIIEFHILHNDILDTSFTLVAGFLTPSVSLQPYHCLDMIELLLKGVGNSVYSSGRGCLKLTTSLDNVSLKFKR